MQPLLLPAVVLGHATSWFAAPARVPTKTLVAGDQATNRWLIGRQLNHPGCSDIAREARQAVSDFVAMPEMAT